MGPQANGCRGRPPGDSLPRRPQVLYNDYAWEEPGHCVQSVLEVRRFLTTEITTLKERSDPLGSLRVTRAACRKFLDTMLQD